MESKSSRVSRRSFLKGTLYALGAVPLASPVQWLSDAVSPSLRVGVLLPPSAVYPAMHRHFLQGLQQGFGTSAALYPAVTGIGAGGLRRAMQQLTDSHAIDYIVALANPNVASSLIDYTTEQQLPTIIASPGMNQIQPHESGPFVQHNSLNYWRASAALAHWSVQQYGRRVSVVSSSYHTGYDSYRVFNDTVEAYGGTIVSEHIVTDDVTTAITAIRRTSADVVAAWFDLDEARAFHRAYQQAGFRLPLIGSPFYGDGAITATVTPVGTPTMPDMFGTLGYDTARTIAAGAQRMSHITGDFTSFLLPSDKTISVKNGSKLLFKRNSLNIPTQHLRESTNNGWSNTYLSM